MKSERFKRTKSVMASGAIALVVAALAFGVSSSVLGTRSAIAQHLGFDLSSGTSSFTITSTVYNEATQRWSISRTISACGSNQRPS